MPPDQREPTEEDLRQVIVEVTPEALAEQLGEAVEDVPGLLTEAVAHGLLVLHDPSPSGLLRVSLGPVTPRLCPFPTVEELEQAIRDGEPGAGGPIRTAP